MRTDLRTLMVVGGAMAACLLGACGKKAQPEKAGDGESAAAEQNLEQGRPKIVAAETTHNFGKVRQGTEVQHVFQISNQGNAELEITNVGASCGCTAAVATQEKVPPGGKTEIKATFRTKGRRGKNRKTITVTSNDPVKPRLVLALEGEIETDVTVEPRSLWLGQISKGERASKEFAVVVRDPQAVEVTSVSIDDSAFAVKLQKEDKGGNATYELTFKGRKELGRISKQLQVVYKAADEENKVRVPVRVEVVGDLRHPKHLRFGKGDDGFKPKSIMFSSRSGKPVRIRSAKDPEGGLKLTVEQAKGTSAVIRAEVADADASYMPPKRGKIVVKTSSRDQPEVEIAYTISERRRAGMRGPHRPMGPHGPMGPRGPMERGRPPKFPGSRGPGAKGGP